MDLEVIILLKKPDKDKDDMTYMWKLKNKQTNELI